MVPPRNATALETPMRQSCDRCYSQKLRCTRIGNNNTGACGRCLHRRVQCVYSFSLPKGRPSVYNLADKAPVTTTGTSAGDGNTSTSTSTSGDGKTDGVGRSPKHQQSSGGPLTHAAAGPRSPHNVSTDTPSRANVDGMVNSGGDEKTTETRITEDTVMLQFEERPTDPWPRMSDMTWDDTQVQWSDSDSSRSNFTWHNFTAPSLAPETTSCVAFPGLVDWSDPRNEANGVEIPASVRNGPGPSTGPPHPPLSVPQFPAHDDGHINSQPQGGNDVDGSNINAVIARLSRLSMQLSRLHRLSSNHSATMEASHQPDRQDQPRKEKLLVDAAFDSVVAWLVNGSADTRDSRPLPALETQSTGTVLYNLLSASQYLLEILHHLQANSGTTTPVLPTPPVSNSSTQDPYEIPGLATSTGSSSYLFSPNDHSNGVIRPLVIACYTILLNVYVSVLTTLERDAEPTRHSVATALGDIRLVSVVQLCSYLTARQYQAMGSYLSLQASSSVLSWQEAPTSGATPPFSDTALGEEMRDLETQLQQQLARLQRALSL
ncbi:hypothetical protein SCUP515_02010 [Seiridium cupressi]